MVGKTNYPLANVYVTNWKITISKSKINDQWTTFKSYFDIFWHNQGPQGVASSGTFHDMDPPLNFPGFWRGFMGASLGASARKGWTQGTRHSKNSLVLSKCHDIAAPVSIQIHTVCHPIISYIILYSVYHPDTIQCWYIVYMLRSLNQAHHSRRQAARFFQAHPTGVDRRTCFPKRSSIESKPILNSLWSWLT